MASPRVVVPPATGAAPMLQRAMTEDYLVERWTRNMLNPAKVPPSVAVRSPRPGTLAPPPQQSILAAAAGNATTQAVYTYPNAPLIQGPSPSRPPPHPSLAAESDPHTFPTFDRAPNFSVTSKGTRVSRGSGSFSVIRQQQGGLVDPDSPLGRSLWRAPLHASDDGGSAYQSQPWLQQQQQGSGGALQVAPTKGLWSKVKKAFTGKKPEQQLSGGYAGTQMGAAATVADVETLWQQQQQDHQAHLQQTWQHHQQHQQQYPGQQHQQHQQQYPGQQHQQYSQQQHGQQQHPHSQQHGHLQGAASQAGPQAFGQGRSQGGGAFQGASQGGMHLHPGNAQHLPAGSMAMGMAGPTASGMAGPVAGGRAPAGAPGAVMWPPGQGGAVTGVWNGVGGGQGQLLSPEQVQQQLLGPWYGHLQAAMQQQYLLAAPVVVPAPVLMDVMAQVQRSNELLRKESQARTHGMRSLVHAVNRNLAVTEQLVLASGVPLPPSAGAGAGGARPSAAWQKALDPASLQRLQHQQHQQQRQGMRLWQEPAHASQLVLSVRALPGDKWDEVRDVRLAYWSVPGLRFRNPADQDTVMLVAQLLKASGVDLAVLQGLADTAAAAKACALLNLWDASGGLECWRYSCSPDLSSGYGLDAETEHVAFVWREPHALPWSASAAAEAAATDAHAQGVRSSGPATNVARGGAGAAGGAAHGASNSFAVVEAGAGGQGATLGAGARTGLEGQGRRSLFAGLFSVNHRPLLILPVSLPRTSTRDRSPHQVASQLTLSIEAATRCMQQQHPGLAGQMWTVVLGEINGDPASVLERSAWQPLLGSGYGLDSEGSGTAQGHQGTNVCVSKVPAGAGRVTSGERAVQPVSQEGEVGDQARAPPRAGSVALKQGLQALLPGSGPLVWGELRVAPRPGLPPQVAAVMKRQEVVGAGHGGRGYREGREGSLHRGRGDEREEYEYGRGRGRLGGEREGYGLEADVAGGDEAGYRARGTAGGKWEEDEGSFGLGAEVGDGQRGGLGLGSRGGSGFGASSKISTPDGPRTPRDTSPLSRPNSRPVSGLPSARGGAGGGTAKGYGLGEELESPRTSGQGSGGLLSGGGLGGRGTGGGTRGSGGTGTGFGLSEDIKLPASGGTGGARAGSGSGSGARGFGLGEEIQSPPPAGSRSPGLSGSGSGGLARPGGAAYGMAGTAKASVGGGGGGSSFGLGEELDLSPRGGAGSAASTIRKPLASSGSPPSLGPKSGGGGGGGGGFGLGEELGGGSPPSRTGSGVLRSGAGAMGKAPGPSPALKPASGGYGLGAEL